MPSPDATGACAVALWGISQEVPHEGASHLCSTCDVGGPGVRADRSTACGRALAVKPITSEAKTTDTDMIRSKIERMGFTDVSGLSRDSLGVWRAKAKRGAETVEVTVDKGGRIKTEPPQ